MNTYDNRRNFYSDITRADQYHVAICIFSILLLISKFITQERRFRSVDGDR